MKKNIPYVMMIMISTLLMSALPTDAEGEIYEDTLRLHILANSDSEEDQALKLLIRDTVLSEYGEILKSAESTNDAIEITEELLCAIKESVDRRLSELGYSYTSRVTLGEEWYDTREYEGFTLPAGYYSSLKISIGNGDGKNWWCVMYPPLCTAIASESAPPDDAMIDYSSEELLLIKSGKYNVKFKILEALSYAFAKNG